MMKEDWESSLGKSFADYMIQYVREGSGGSDTVESQKNFTMNQI